MVFLSDMPCQWYSYMKCHVNDVFEVTCQQCFCLKCHVNVVLSDTSASGSTYCVTSYHRSSSCWSSLAICAPASLPSGFCSQLRKPEMLQTFSLVSWYCCGYISVRIGAPPPNVFDGYMQGSKLRNLTHSPGGLVALICDSSP